MLRKNFLKLALIIPAMAGLSVMAGTPDFLVKEGDKAVVSTTEAGKVTVDKTVHDFGTVSKNGGSVSTVFTLTNNTKGPVILTKVRASCGCTTPSWTKEPIESGKSGEVTATFSPIGAGPFEKSVTINIASGDKTETIIVKIKGVVE